MSLVPELPLPRPQPHISAAPRGRLDDAARWNLYAVMHHMSNVTSRHVGGASGALVRFSRPSVPMENESIRVVLADDHALMREGLRLLLRSAPGIDVVGEAADGSAALALARRLNPHVVLLDLDMPVVDGETALRELQLQLPQLRVLILTVHAEHERLVPLLEAGARGYLCKEAAAAELIEAIRIVAAGGVYVRPTAARLLAAAVVPHCTAETAGDQLRALSDRERTIVRLLSEGYSQTEIARQLGVSTKTVDAYKHRVQAKLGLAHRRDFVRFAIEAGILGR